MKIIDENGVELTEAPDLTLGRLVDDVEIVHHDAIAGVQQVSHYVPIEHLANGSTIVEEVIDVPGVEPKPAWDETVPIQRYIKYTQDELDAQAEAKKKAEEAAAAEAKKKAELETVPGRMDALEAANDDLVLMMADLIGG